MRVLLVGHAASREMLAAARCLGRAGHEVAVASGARRSLAGGSRHVHGEHRVPPPDVDVGGFVDAVAAAAAATRAEVAIGCGDPELLALSHHREQIPARVPLAAHDRVVHAVDKLGLVREAAAVGIAVPETVIADDRAVAAWRGPAVVKARLHWEPGLQSASGGWASARHVPADVSPAAAVRAVVDAGRSPVLQRPVDGDLIAVSAVRDSSGDLVALHQQHATHTWPPGAGISTRAFTVRPDPELAEQVRRLLARLGWIGMVQLQFLRPTRGPARLIDLNGRPYGSLALALAAGLPLPALWLDDHADVPGARPSGVRLGAAGVGYSWLGGDLRRALAERRGGALRDLAGTLRAWPGAAHPVADPADRGPVRRLPILVADEACSRLRGGR
ncbi:hypothetical protein [Nocardioides donggukensis]|uniref:ATP-grasp domain-containing protein n=1 Tax=Nocardioides donggukensis TaxID=2774019 RepID=A0A927Q1J3_9ACTN|nr:hypothetical protein [Nocardioides donggukensis]MBD8869504.1 hypothetical protein [Nocardioides donggukensis]